MALASPGVGSPGTDNPSFSATFNRTTSSTLGVAPPLMPMVSIATAFPSLPTGSSGTNSSRAPASQNPFIDSKHSAATAATATASAPAAAAAAATTTAAPAAAAAGMSVTVPIAANAIAAAALASSNSASSGSARAPSTTTTAAAAVNANKPSTATGTERGTTPAAATGLSVTLPLTTSAGATAVAATPKTAAALASTGGAPASVQRVPSTAASATAPAPAVSNAAGALPVALPASALPTATAAPVGLPVVVPRLDDLLIKALAENYHVYPAFDRIPAEYVDNVVALLDPSKIRFTTACTYITTEKFWRRLCKEKWAITEVGAFGQSWKRMYVERHIAHLIENYVPSKEVKVADATHLLNGSATATAAATGGVLPGGATTGPLAASAAGATSGAPLSSGTLGVAPGSNQNLTRLTRDFNAAKPYLHSIRLGQVPSHLDLSELCWDANNLNSLDVRYGMKRVGMDYDKTLFGIGLNDAMGIAKLILRTKTLNRLTLTESWLNDETLHILSNGLQYNDTITALDLSHNKISDAGAKRLSTVLSVGATVLTELHLSDNSIHADGCNSLSRALATNPTLRVLSLRLNPIGDDAGAALLKALHTNRTLTKLDLGSTGLRDNSARELESLLSSASESRLVSLDVSSNEVARTGTGGDELAKILQTRCNLIHFDLRKNVLQPDAAAAIAKCVSEQKARVKQNNRKKFQGAIGDPSVEWDNAL